MKRFVYLLVACLFMTAGTAWGQGDLTKEQEKAAKKEAKEKEKALQEAEEMAMFEEAVDALNAQNFVLEADRVEFKRGEFLYVTANTNFVSLVDGRATIQLTLNGPAPGPNGIGGITVEGIPSNIKMSTSKKGDVTFSMMVQGVGVSASVFITLPKGTAKCTATVSPNFNSNRMSFTGTLYPSSKSEVYKGRVL